MPPSVEKVRDMARGDTYNLSVIKTGLHAGTHADAPLHFVSGGVSIDAIPPDRFIGRCRVVEIDPQRTMVSASDLMVKQPQRDEILLIKTSNSQRSYETFDPNYVALDVSGAAYLAACGVKTVGIDCLSIGRDNEVAAVHLALMGEGITILEGLDLSAINPGEYFLSALPPKIKGAEGAPVRAVLVEGL